MTACGAALTSNPDTSADRLEPVQAEVWLRIKPNTAARGHVDGAWWPRSHDPAAEFPGLVLSAAGPDTVDSIELILASNGSRSTRQGHRI
jgi:Family of unknown function (DUF5994)